jgi:hypothetical protein
MKLGMSLAAVAALAACSFVQAGTLRPVASDQAVNDLIINEVGVAEGRIGDRGGNGEWEYGVYDGVPPAPTAGQGNYDWISGSTVPFSLVYDGNQTLTFTLDGNSASWSNFPATDFNSIVLRTVAFKDNSSLVLDNLMLDGSAVNGSVSAINGTTPNNRGLAVIQSDDLDDSNGFALTGDATLSWSNPIPLRSNLAFQLKVVDATVIPEPASVTAGLAALGLIGLRRRR